MFGRIGEHQNIRLTCWGEMNKEERFIFLGKIIFWKVQYEIWRSFKNGR